MKSVKQELVYVDTANCGRDGCMYCKTGRQKVFYGKGYKLHFKNRQGKITVAT
jgi:hypothetical protein